MEEILISPDYNTRGTLSEEESILDRTLTSKDGKYTIAVSEIYNGTLMEKEIEPGLYDAETNELKMSWQELLNAENIITVTNGVLTRGSEAGNGLDGKLVVSDTVTAIGNPGFTACNKLVSIDLPNTITSVGNAGFAACSALTSMALPESVTSIGNAAFQRCTSLNSITIKGKVTSWGYQLFDYSTNLTTVTLGTSNLDSGMEKVPSNVFQSANSLTSVIMKDSIKSIEQNAFGGEGEFAMKNITSVTMSKNLTNIGINAFGNCTGINDIIIPEKVENIGTAAFHDWTDSQTINVLGYTSKPTGYADGWNGNANVVWKSE